jgi:ANTAR domain-containing protein
VCRHLVTGLPVDSAAITVATTNRNRRVLAASDPRIIRIERLQHTLGEGPGITAFAEAITVQMDPTVDGHPWPVFAAAIASEQVGALAAFPLRIGRAHSSIGTLLLCRRDPGVLSQATVSAAEGWAATIGATLAVFTRGRRAPDSASLGDPDSDAINTAAGILMAGLRVSADDAIVRMQAYAFTHDRLLVDVATDLLAQRLSTDDFRH